MSKVLALDIGDVWTGIAISDPMQIIAKPYHTYPTEKLEQAIAQIRHEHQIERIVVGHPKTMRGTESEQTQRVRDRYTQLQEHIPDIPCVLWDERLSSQRAEALETKKPRSKEEKRMTHARAAAFILDTYLQAHN